MKFDEQTLDYILPDEKIALFPLTVRHQSKLLIYKNKQISHDTFIHLSNYLPSGACLVFNNTKVIRARMYFYTISGAKIEIFCLEPAQHYEPSMALAATSEVKWICMVGGVRKWKRGVATCAFTVKGQEIIVNAHIINRRDDLFEIEFSWNNNNIHFSDILENAGELPLPPYLNRKEEKNDNARYQTIYAKEQGSVAAPTAGLHFTNEVFESFKEKQINTDYITLHVGAGTFKPIKTDLYTEHIMHEELIEVSIDNLEFLFQNLGKIIAVGTTSLRVIESLYWIGVKIILNKQISIKEMHLGQWEAYQLPQNTGAKEALGGLKQWARENAINKLILKTGIMITPHYSLKVAEGIITNFHQPKSTLLLIVAAIAGEQWKEIYEVALKNNYRFLSYGDSSLLMKCK